MCRWCRATAIYVQAQDSIPAAACILTYTKVLARQQQQLKARAYQGRPLLFLLLPCLLLDASKHAQIKGRALIKNMNTMLPFFCFALAGDEVVPIANASYMLSSTSVKCLCRVIKQVCCTMMALVWVLCSCMSA